MRPRPLLLACALAALLVGGGAVRADISLAPPPERALRPLPAPPPPPTLAQALAVLGAPEQDLFLTVGADKVLLPPGTVPATPDDRPGQVGEAYGLLARDFGGVMALAPPTMVVLNTRPGTPDPHIGLSPEEALKLLLAGLTPSQWAALTSEAGLAVLDLDTEAQRGDFEAVLPAGDLTAFPEYDPLISNPNPPDATLRAADRAGARLRLGRRMEIEVPLEVGPAWQTGAEKTAWRKESVTYKAPPGGAGYDANSAPVAPPGAVYGAVLRETRPNNPKDADLDYSAPALRQSVGVDGLETVGDLVARVGRAAGLELYAGRRYEGRRVTLVGRRTARAVDLLRATAFCLTGTFRRVGPAYVLTDDREGTAPRRRALRRFVERAEMARAGALEATEDGLAAAHGDEGALPWLGGPGFSDAQRALPQFNPEAGGDLSVPFALLTPAQQSFVLDRVTRASAGTGARLDAGGRFVLQGRTHLLLVSPALPGPFLLEYLPLYNLFRPSPAAQEKQTRRKGKEAAKAPAAPPPPVVPPAALRAALAPYARRAALVAPRTAAEVAGVVASMKALGLNQLWLDVFSGGHSRLDTGILAEALARTKGRGIAVIPALDLLRWGADAPEGARDLTAQGETSAEQETWAGRYAHATCGWMFEAPYVPPSDVWACPAAPAVEETLLGAVRRLAATPGVTTLAVRDAVPPGYQRVPGVEEVGETDLGYVPALRLASLRRDHVDPVDLDGETTLPGGADISLPGLDDWAALQSASQAWGLLRDGAGRDLLRRLLAAAKEAGGPRFRFLVERRGDTTWGGGYGLWGDPQAPLPETPFSQADRPEPGGVQPFSEAEDARRAGRSRRAAQAQCRVTLQALPPWGASSAPLVALLLRRLEPGWGGVVLDVSGAGGAGRLAGLAGTPARASRP